jgi:hypothetical protein
LIGKQCSKTLSTRDQIQKEVISGLKRENQFLSKEIWEPTQRSRTEIGRESPALAGEGGSVYVTVAVS